MCRYHVLEASATLGYFTLRDSYGKLHRVSADWPLPQVGAVLHGAQAVRGFALLVGAECGQVYRSSFEQTDIGEPVRQRTDTAIASPYNPDLGLGRTRNTELALPAAAL